jgi:hypothetical protein
MSFKLRISQKERAAGRFIGSVRKALVLAAIEEKKLSGITQADVASKLEVDRSFVNRLLRGNANLTLKTIGELSWAMGWEPVFTMRRLNFARGTNHGMGTESAASQPPMHRVVRDEENDVPYASASTARIKITTPADEIA